ncbi:MAG: YraN family protein [Nitrospirae bacterium]|nr:YraN family protein [Nitrospirota bacterium]
MRLGREGEELAIKFLKKNGYKIIEQNYKTPLGEIDIIAKDGETLTFIEVKARESLQFGQPFEAVNYTKRKKITKVALSYIKKLKEVPPCRFDVMSVYFKEGRPEVELIRDAFEAAVRF